MTYGLLTFDWDATRAMNLKAGDAFQIALPAEFNFKVPSTRPFSFDLDGDGTVGPDEQIGECLIEDTTMTCTFNQKAADKVAAGYTGLRGSGKVQLAAVKTTDKQALDFTINGTETVTVQLPPPGGIIDPIGGAYHPTVFTKDALAIDERSTKVTWYLGFGTENLAQEYARAGITKTFDGVTPETIVMKDVLGPGVSCPSGDNPDDVHMKRLNSVTAPDARTNRLVIAHGNKGPETTAAGTFELSYVCGTPTAQGTPIDITITGNFAPQTNYEILYATPVTSDSGMAVPGFVYTNQVQLEGTDVRRTITRSYVDSFSLIVNMKLGYGTFKVAKYVQGTGADKIAPGSTFRVKVDYELPNGATQDQYPDWVHPGTLNPAKNGGTAEFDVVMGKITTFVGPSAPVTLPKGTKVTLSEINFPAAPAGVRWSTNPTFRIGGANTNVFTIEDQQILGVELTNTLEAIPTGSFSVAKRVDGARVDGKEFSFDYSCVVDGVVKAKGDGVAVAVGESFPTGTECTVSEDVASAQVDGYSLTAPAAQRLRIDAKDQVVAFEFTNTYAENPKPTPTPEPSPSGTPTPEGPASPAPKKKLAIRI